MVDFPVERKQAKGGETDDLEMPVDGAAAEFEGGGERAQGLDESQTPVETPVEERNTGGNDDEDEDENDEEADGEKQNGDGAKHSFRGQGGRDKGAGGGKGKQTRYSRRPQNTDKNPRR